MMKTLIEFHGVLRQLAGAASLQLELAESATVADAMRQVAQISVEMAQRLERCACAIGDQLVPRSTPLREGARLALIPPVSGG